MMTISFILLFCYIAFCTVALFKEIKDSENRIIEEIRKKKGEG